ncbi:MAG: hypothetical protein JWL77_1778 [Chthonomonadaceae bacterium]|nr:hypothetical protein [Chthonomonadaceae bacterium]
MQLLCFLLLEAWICWSIFGFTQRPKDVDWLTLCSLYANKRGLFPGVMVLAAPIYYFFSRGLNLRDGQVVVGGVLTLLSFIVAWTPAMWLHLCHLHFVWGLVIRILVLLWLTLIFYWYTLARSRPVLALFRKGDLLE